MEWRTTLQTVKRLLQGKPFLSHPVHVVLVHFPLTLTPVGFLFDLMSTRKRQYRDLQVAGYYANLWAIIISLPTYVTGIAEWADIPRDHPAWLTATIHAALNDLVIGMAIYNWWTRRKRRNYGLERSNLIVGALATAVLGISGWLGGLLSYDHGLGVQRQGTALDTKHEDEAWERSHGQGKPAFDEGNNRIDQAIDGQAEQAS
ncbi:MAG: hypothetical protein NVS4B8_19870 [Herpetosiphon sp.]